MFKAFCAASRMLLASLLLSVLIVGCGKSEQEIAYRTKAGLCIDGLRTLQTIGKEVASVSFRHNAAESNAFDKALQEYDKKLLDCKITVDSFLALDERAFRLEGFKEEVQASLQCHTYASRAIKQVVSVDSSEEMFDKIDGLRKELTDSKDYSDITGVGNGLGVMRVFAKRKVSEKLWQHADSHMQKAEELLKANK